MGRTRQVTTYGRRPRNFIKVVDVDLIPSPVKKDPLRSPSLESLADVGISPPRARPRFKPISTLSNENATSVISSPRHRSATDTGSTSPGTRRRLDQQTARARALTTITAARNRKPLAPKLPNVSTPPKKTRRQSKVAAGPRRSDVEIIVLDQDGSQISCEKRFKMIDNSPRSAVEVESDDDDIPLKPITPLLRRASPKKKMIVVSSDEDEDEPKILSSPLAKRKPSLPKPSQPPRASSSSAAASRETSILAQQSSQLSTTSSKPKSTKPDTSGSRIRDALLRLPHDVLASVASSGNLEGALPHLSPSTRKHIEDHLSSSQKSDVPAIPDEPSFDDEVIEETDVEDLLEEISELSFRGLAVESDVESPPTSPTPSYSDPALTRLLARCQHSDVILFDEFVETFPSDPIHSHSFKPTLSTSGRKSMNKKKLIFRKIGEASFSEVFAIGDVVIKIVPLQVEGQNDAPVDVSDEELPCRSSAADVEKEVLVTHEMGEAHDGFVKLIQTHVVRGSYPSLFLDLWDQYEEVKGSENIRPDVLPPDTHYALIVLSNGGADLESYKFPLLPSKDGTVGPWRLAFSIMWQLIRALAVAEECNQFEHRDLHWGQLLVKDAPETPLGAVVTIIDFGLSRMKSADGRTHYSDFDDAIFEGEGDYQFDVYRMMKKHNRGSWAEFCPLTNVMWLHYVVDKLIHSKGLTKPVLSRSTKGKKTASQLAKEEEKVWYDKVVAMDAFLATALHAHGYSPSSGVGRKKKAVGKGIPISSACDVMKWLVEEAP